MQRLSQFKPVDKQYYQIIHYDLALEQPMTFQKVQKSPKRKEKKELTKRKEMIPKSPKNSVDTKKIVKKRWNPMLKQLAVEKALELGLTHATLHLQSKEPELYAKLTPSTLQYWVQQYHADKLVKN